MRDRKLKNFLVKKLKIGKKTKVQFFFEIFFNSVEKMFLCLSAATLILLIQRDYQLFSEHNY